MNTTKNIGLIECGEYGQALRFNSANHSNGYSIKKVLMSDAAFAGRVKSQFPQVEIVSDKDAILKDHTIDLVIVSAPKANQMNMVAEVLQAGKSVQIL